mgnify:CR=1 FL=1
MKEYIDFFSTLQGELFAKKKLAHMLKKYWGTTNIDGVEVYNKKFVVWPNTHTPRVRKVLDIFNIPVSQINNQSKNGIEQLYLKFDSGKQDTSSLSREALATMLEADVPFNEWREFTLGYTDQSNPEKFNGWTVQQIFTYVDDNYKSSIYQNVAMNVSGNIEGIDDYIGAYVLLDNGVDFVVEAMEASVVPIPIQPAHDPEETDFNKRWEKPSMFVSGINVRYRYKRTGYLNDDSPVVKELANDIVYGSSTPRYSIGSAALSFLRRNDAGKTNILWYKGCIRVDTAKKLKKHDYGKLIYGSVDLDYKKKETSGWKKLLGPLIVVVAVVITVFTWGAASPLVTIATAATLTTVALTVAQMVLAKSGDFDGAGRIGRWVKITGTISLIAGIASIVQNLVRAAATEAIKQGAGQVASQATSSAASITVDNMVVQLSEISIQNYVSGIGNMLSSSMSSMTWFNKLSTAGKVVGPIMEYREKNKAKELTSLSEEVKAQQTELADIYDKNLHIGLEDIRTYTRPLTQDNAQFQTDYLYEGTKFHILRPSFARYGMNVISNDIRPITERIRNT